MRAPGGGPTVPQEPTLTVLLVLPNLEIGIGGGENVLNARGGSHPKSCPSRTSTDARGRKHTVASKIITPEKKSELIRLGVIYYAGNFLPPKIFVELIMRGNSVSHYVDRLFWGVKNHSKKSNGNSFLCGVISELPHKIVFELIG